MSANLSSRLEGVRLVAFESRRARELGELVRRYGGQVFVAPSMQEVPLAENPLALEFFRDLEAGRFDFVVFLTGVGTRALATVIETHYSKDQLVAALGKVRLVARGPKPVAALREMGLAPAITAQEPNTWREVLKALDDAAALPGSRVAVQEYGISNRALVDGLETRGMRVVTVPVYQWALPDDIAPLQSAIQQILGGHIDVAIFTSATQVVHLFQLAGAEQSQEKLAECFASMFVASVGPVCSDALRSYGIIANLEPEKPKMGQLVAELAQLGTERLRKA